ncbi:Putative NTF2-like domain superfamily protein [Septoria linicola]|uniref:NTF2-like domain superfamily protein n=1 Tax=Septoria linicola TaxID=215465 RepID=A0A9Q9AP76_9PEZI|nr:putative NTF2-like domain superfamily protein [Septoria linicola]USW49572.1 Putative NTF2-like domain superfamily protein [Septoria linicola]
MTVSTAEQDADIYSKLSKTARAFIESTNSATPRSNHPDYDLIRSYCAPHFRISWAPKLFAQNSPVLGAPQDIHGFVEHIQKMSNHLSTWAILVQDVFVDVRKRTVIARADFWMLPADGGDKVLNDIVFFIKCDETGEKVVDCCEYVDPFASQQIKERISAKAWRESAAGQTLGNGVKGTNGTDGLHHGDGEGIPPDGAAF